MTNDDGPNNNGRTFGDILVVQNASLPASIFPTNEDSLLSDTSSVRTISEGHANMSALWNDKLGDFSDTQNT